MTGGDSGGFGLCASSMTCPIVTSMEHMFFGVMPNALRTWEMWSSLTGTPVFSRSLIVG